MRNKLLTSAVTVPILFGLAAEFAYAGQVPVVRPSNLGVSSPTLPRPISAAPSVATGAASTGGGASLGLSGASPTGQQAAPKSSGLINIPSTTAISATISDVSAAVGKSGVTLSPGQRENLARTVTSVLENVSMSPEQRAQLIGIRESLEHAE